MGETLPAIIVEIETPASAGEAWSALTEPERIAEWFTDASPLGAVGDPYRLDFGDGSVVEGVVRVLEPGHRFAHTWAWVDAIPRQETLVTWSVEPLPDGGGRVTLVHDGWSEAGADAATRGDPGRPRGLLERLSRQPDGAPRRARLKRLGGPPRAGQDRLAFR